MPASAGGRPASQTTTLGSGTELAGSPDEPEINSRMTLPLPDETAAAAAVERLYALDVPGAGLGNLARLIGFAGGTQGTGAPGPYRAPRLLLVHGAHHGGLAAGESAASAQREVDRALAGESALGVLAASAGVPVQVVDVTAEPAGAVEDGNASDPERIAVGLRQGFRLAEAVVDAGTDLIILGAVGAGQVGAAAAVVGATITIDPAAVLPRVVRAGGRIDDDSWMVRCAALRDGLRRAKGLSGPEATLTVLGGYDLAVATGIVLGATYRRTAVLIDGPVGVAAGLMARELGAQSRLWLLVADDGRHPVVTPAAKVLGASAVADLRLDLGEGAAGLAVFPLLQNALLLATLPTALTEATDPPSAPDAAEPDTADPESADLAGPDSTDLAGADPAGLTGADPAGLTGADPAGLTGPDSTDLTGPDSADLAGADPADPADPAGADPADPADPAGADPADPAAADPADPAAADRGGSDSADAVGSGVDDGEAVTGPGVAAERGTPANRTGSAAAPESGEPDPAGDVAGPPAG